MAQLEMRVGDFSAAEQQLRALLELNPSHERSYVQLAGLMALQGKHSEVRLWLERALTADPAAVEARLRLAQLAFADGDGKRARLLLAQVLKVAEDGAAQNAIGEVLMYSGNFDEALDRFEEAAQAGSQVALLNIAHAQLALGHVDAARQALESPQIGPELRIAAAIMRVQIVAQQGRAAEALNAITELRKQGIPEAVAEALAGDINMTLRHFDTAVGAYEAAWRRAPNRTLAIKLFRARQLAGVEDPARSLREWLDHSGGDQRARYVLAEHYRLTGQQLQAIQQYELLVQHVSRSEPMILNNLAWLYYEAGDRRAVGVALKAYDAAREVPEIADTYGWILVEQGRTIEGLAALEQAARGAPENPEIRYHLAAAYARAGNQARAVDLLARLLKSEDPFPSRDGAEHLFRTLAAH
jgi:putative PEP-CTERM system TPR-repeat lipoprotein